MDAHTGRWSLTDVRIRYSETGGSSLGVRFYLKYLLADWKSRNPQVNMRTAHSVFQHPKLTVTYRSGETDHMELKNLTARQIEDVLNLYRNSHGPNKYLKHGGPRCWSQRRSIQGLWQPSLEATLKQLRWFHARENGHSVSTSPLKYSEASLKLSAQALQGTGRWGSELNSPKGFDTHILTSALRNPLMDGIRLLKKLPK